MNKKNIILIRHSTSNMGPIDDFKRILSERGKIILAEQSKKIKYDGYLKKIDSLYCSSSYRTTQTGKELVSLGVIDKNDWERASFLDILYNSNLSKYLKCLLHTENSSNSAMIIGHNPIIRELANYLCDDAEEIISFRPADVLILEANVKNWTDLYEKSCNIVKIYKAD